MTDDARLRTAFDELRAEDMRIAPSFGAVRQRSSVPRVMRRTSLAFRLVAAGVVIAAAIATYASFSPKHQRFTVPSEVVALSAWRPATDALLPPVHGAFGAGPALGRSILDLDPLTTGVAR